MNYLFAYLAVGAVICILALILGWEELKKKRPTWVDMAGFLVGTILAWPFVVRVGSKAKANK